MSLPICHFRFSIFVLETLKFEWQSLVDPRRALVMCPPLGPNSFIFMQFSVKEKLQNNRLAHPLWELALNTGKSWINHLQCSQYLEFNPTCALLGF